SPNRVPRNDYRKRRTRFRRGGRGAGATPSPRPNYLVARFSPDRRQRGAVARSTPLPRARVCRHIPLSQTWATSCFFPEDILAQRAVWRTLQRAAPRLLSAHGAGMFRKAKRYFHVVHPFHFASLA